MKKVLLTLFVCVLCSVMFAETVTEKDAKQKAIDFMKSKGMITGKQDAKVVAKSQLQKAAKNATPYYYVFNAGENNGFVIVSGDDRADEILGYATKGNFDNSNVPINMQGWLQSYSEQIKSLNDDAGTLRMIKPASKTAVAPLITTQWGQSRPFNNLCPTEDPDSLDKRCITGCVATAMAQIFNYFEWPQDFTTAIPAYTTKTYGFEMPELPATKFDWTKMKDNYYSEAAKNDSNVAKLMLYCGQSVCVDYDYYQSSAPTSRKVFVNYFGYDQSVREVSRGNYTYSGWNDLIYNEVAAGRPVLYSGYDAFGGHTFICDGYDGDGMFHINWGWEGYCDGYFKLSVLNNLDQEVGVFPVIDGYSMDQNAIIGIQRNTGVVKQEEVLLKVSKIAIAQTDYTRTSATKNFTDIKAKVTFLNELEEAKDFDFGLALYNGEDMLQVLYKNSYSKLGSNYTISPDATVSFGANLADGVYQIRPISRESNVSADWKMCTDADKTYIQATVKGNSLTLKNMNWDDVNLVINSMVFNGMNKEFRHEEVILNVTNNGTSTYSNVYLFIDGVMMTAVGVGIDPGQTGEITMNFIPTNSGTQTVTITSDDKGKQVLKTDSLVITKSDFANLLMQVNVQDVSDDRQSILGNKFKAKVKVNNIGNDYNDNICAILCKLDTTNSWGTSERSIYKEISLASGDSTTVDFEFDNLEYGSNYFVQIMYYSYSSTINGVTSYYYMMSNATGVKDAEKKESDTSVHNLFGHKIGTSADMDFMPSGIYIIKGKKVLKK